MFFARRPPGFTPFRSTLMLSQPNAVSHADKNEGESQSPSTGMRKDNGQEPEGEGEPKHKHRHKHRHGAKKDQRMTKGIGMKLVVGAEVAIGVGIKNTVKRINTNIQTPNLLRSQTKWGLIKTKPSQQPVLKQHWSWLVQGLQGRKPVDLQSH